MRRLLVMLFAVVAFMSVGAMSAFAADDGGGGGGDDGVPCVLMCGDDNPMPPEPGEACPPATGPISSVVQSLSDAIRSAGGAGLADLLDTVNCQLVVGVLNLTGPATGM